MYVSLFGLLSSVARYAQSNESELRTRLFKKPLFLRGHWVDDKLAFDTRGNLLGDSKSVIFTLAGIDVSAVKLSSRELTITGKRMGLSS